MPNVDHDRISNKLRDLIYVLLVPNPAERPNIDQVGQLLKNWNNLPKINLPATAAKIKAKNGTFGQPSSGTQMTPAVKQVQQRAEPASSQFVAPRSGGMGLTADDYARMQEQIKRDAEKKQVRKQHVGANRIDYEPL